MIFLLCVFFFIYKCLANTRNGQLPYQTRNHWEQTLCKQSYSYLGSYHSDLLTTIPSQPYSHNNLSIILTTLHVDFVTNSAVIIFCGSLSTENWTTRLILSSSSIHNTRKSWLIILHSFFSIYAYKNPDIVSLPIPYCLNPNSEYEKHEISLIINFQTFHIHHDFFIFMIIKFH